ncbi:hypothetical protein acsn021_09890 [Anaerocolumna cellulosilytica]|uniref:Uncharacterized protein n=1 Tax=Anaerocolumna cellulosilytica TaxID=433286 RepID=A0A6S6R278_9FIRM|nr:hypothetical protein [Anaerocolumna cellulosilytica]MBB5194475.1 hypothetical protein [Anaerocolumna cellulosilytica]BCJ93420.1 hypothetical protein acsn021_09890 [Anaerocolumna cellulosilytica]
MNHTIKTLLVRILDLENFFESFYRNLALSQEAQKDYALKNTAAILSLEEKRHGEVCQELINKDVGAKHLISDDILSQVEYFLITLKQSANSYGILTAKQLIAHAIDSENRQITLLNRILELLRKDNIDSSLEEVFVYLLEEESKHVNNLQVFLK